MPLLLGFSTAYGALSFSFLASSTSILLPPSLSLLLSPPPPLPSPHYTPSLAAAMALALGCRGTAFALAVFLLSASAKCPDLASLRSPAVASSFNSASAAGLFYENRFTDLAQIGASCQHMVKTPQPGGSIAETYTVNYGPLPFPLPLFYNSSGKPLGVSDRYMTLFPKLTFPSVVVDVDVGANGTYSALVEYLCWDVLGLDYVELRISTREASPSSAYLDSLEARARALGVTWSGALTVVNFSSCPPFTAAASAATTASNAATLSSPLLPALSPPLFPAPARYPAPARLPTWARARAHLARTGTFPLRNASDDVVLPGIRPGLPQLALVFIQGAECEPAAYVPLLRAIQAAVVDFDVIVGAPDAPLIHTPDPVTLGVDVGRVLHTMETTAGLVLNTSRVVFVAHSLGGLVLQTWLDLADFVSFEPAAAVLLGSYVTREFRAGVNSSNDAPAFRFPTASIVGELDGLARVSRFAEAWWWQIGRSAGNASVQAAFPVLYVPGMSHGQWATFTGPVPSEVATYDLTPEVNTTAAQAHGAALIATYLSSAVGGSSAATAALAVKQSAASDFFAPLVAAQVYESSYHLVPPCYVRCRAIRGCGGPVKALRWRGAWRARVWCPFFP